MVSLCGSHDATCLCATSNRIARLCHTIFCFDCLFSIFFSWRRGHAVIGASLFHLHQISLHILCTFVFFLVFVVRELGMHARLLPNVIKCFRSITYFSISCIKRVCLSATLFFFHFADSSELGRGSRFSISLLNFSVRWSIVMCGACIHVSSSLARFFSACAQHETLCTGNQRNSKHDSAFDFCRNFISFTCR